MTTQKFLSLDEVELGQAVMIADHPEYGSWSVSKIYDTDRRVVLVVGLPGKMSMDGHDWVEWEINPVLGK